jgi:hypothetical protein
LLKLSGFGKKSRLKKSEQKYDPDLKNILDLKSSG